MDYKKLIFENPFIGYAYHKIITSENGNPIDYEFIEVNNQYETLTGLKAGKISGKTILEVFPDITKEKFDWINFFGKVALTGKSDKALQYVDNFNKWYSVQATCPQIGYFIATVVDITDIKKKETELKEINEEYAALNEEHLTQNEELQALLEESHEKNVLIENSLVEVKKSKSDLLRKEVLQTSILNSTVNGILAIDNKGKVIFANEKFYEMWNIPDHIRESKNDQKLIQFILGQLAKPKEFIEKVQQLYHSRDICNDAILFSDHRIFKRYSEALIEDNKLIGRIWSFEDITEQEEQKQLLRKTNRILEGIRKINSLQIVATDPKKLIEDICHNIVNEFGFESVMINLFDQGKYYMGAQFKYGLPIEKIKSHLEKGRTIPCFRRVNKENNIIVIDNHSECNECSLSKEKFKYVFVVPIKHKKHLLGYINIKQKEEDTYDDSYLGLLKEIGNEIALAIIKVNLEKDQEKYTKEIALRENKLTSILQSSPIGIAHLQNDRLVDVNHKFSKIAGLPINKLIGKSLEDFFVDSSKYYELKEIIESDLKKSESEEFEIEWRKDKFKKIDVLLTFAIINPLNIKEGFSITIEDITAKKKDRLIKSILLKISRESNKSDNTGHLAQTIQEELGRLFSTDNFYIALYNPDKDMYNFPYHVDKFEHDYVDPDKLYDLSGSLTDFVRKEKCALLINEKQETELLDAGKIKQVGVESPLWMAAPFIDSNSNSFGVIAVQHYKDKDAYNKEDLEVLDNVAHYLSKIYEKKSALKKLKESEEKYRQLIENSGEGVINVDLHENILLVNNAGAEIFGVEKQKLIGRNLAEFFAPDQFEIIKKQTKVRLQGKKSMYELIVSNRKGTNRNILLTATPIYKNDVIVGNLGVFRDITKQKRSEMLLKNKNEELQAAEEELRASNEELKFVNDELENRNDELLIAKEKAESADRLKSAFLANMSHEIRTPMNSILGFSELLKNEGFSKEKRNHFIDIINRNGEQLVSIISDIVDFSKIEANQLDLHYSIVDLSELFQDIYYTFSMNKDSDKNIRLKLELPSNEKLLINTDGIRIKQVLSNLVGNAFKFTQKGEIIVGFKQEYKQVICFVKDTGIGIHKDKQEIIFERFRQADDSRTRKYGGTGLGLTISKRIIEMLGGTMWVDSIYGEGSQFYFSLKA